MPVIAWTFALFAGVSMDTMETQYWGQGNSVGRVLVLDIQDHGTITAFRARLTEEQTR